MLLRFEGIAQIRLPLVQQRMEGIKFIFRMLNLPLCSFTVVRLQDFFANPRWENRRAEVTAQNLVMINEPSGTELGLWLPADSLEHGHQVALPDMGNHSLRPLVVTSRMQDLELLQNLGLRADLAAPAELVRLLDKPAESISEEGVLGECQKMRTKLNHLIDKIKQVVDGFAKASWTKCASAPLGVVQQRLNKLRDEAQSNAKLTSKTYVKAGSLS